MEVQVLLSNDGGSIEKYCFAVNQIPFPKTLTWAFADVISKSTEAYFPMGGSPAEGVSAAGTNKERA